MRRITRALAMITFLLLGALPAFSQETDAEDTLKREVINLMRTGQYDRGIVVIKKALEVAETNFGLDHPKVATRLDTLAEFYRLQKKYAETEPLYKRSLAILEKAHGPDHPDVARSLNNLATLYDDQEQYAAAEPLYKRSLAISEKALGPDHADVTTSRSNLAELYRAMNRDEEAEALDQRAAPQNLPRNKEQNGL